MRNYGHQAKQNYSEFETGQKQSKQDSYQNTGTGYELKQPLASNKMRASNSLINPSPAQGGTYDYNAFGFSNYMTEREIHQQKQMQYRDQMRQKAIEAESKFIQDALLDKYRPEPPQVATKQMNDLEKMLVNKAEKQNKSNEVMEQSYNNLEQQQYYKTRKKQKDFESALMQDYSKDETILFKDQIKEGSYGQPQLKKNHLLNQKTDVLVLSDGDDDDCELEIVDRHMDSPNVTPSKKSENFAFQNKQETTSNNSSPSQIEKMKFFKQRSEQAQQQLTYGSIQNNFYAKYFNSNQQKSDKSGSIDQKNFDFQQNYQYPTLQDSSSILSSDSRIAQQKILAMAKNNQFLNLQNSRGSKYNKNQSSYQNSSFNQSTKSKTTNAQWYLENSDTNTKFEEASISGLKAKDLNQLKTPFKPPTTEEIIRKRDLQNLNFAKKTIAKKFGKKETVKEQKVNDDQLKREKLREILRLKRKKAKQINQQNEFDELFDESRLDSLQNNKDKGGFLQNLATEDQDGLEALKLFDHGDDQSPNQNMLEEGNLEQNLTPEELELYNHQMQTYNERAEIQRCNEIEEQLRYIRYKNRNNVDELIKPILNLEIVQKYCDLNLDDEDQEMKQQFPTLPLKFDNSQQYFDIWIQLFLYETYNQLINQRNESAQDRELSKLYGMKLKNDNSQKNFQGLIQRNKQDLNFIYLKLLEKDEEKSTAITQPQSGQAYQRPFPHISCLKEFDLLLLSEEKLDTTNVKQLTNSKFLMDISKQDGKFMGMVDKKRSGDKCFIEIKIDISHEQYVQLNCSEFQYHSMHIYYFDSMSTRIREFRTIKSAEFYPASKYILNPALIPKRDSDDQEMEDEGRSSEEKCNNQLQDKSELDQATTTYSKNEQSTDLKLRKLKKPMDRHSFEMQTFIDNHKSKFNSSQYQALIDVSMMKPVDFLLIQGPPGTGKTHTIKGIISMLNNVIRKDKKILVCAPSNAAIDEIITRLISKGGLLGQSEEESIAKVLRIGAFDYEPSPIVKQVLFDTKINKGYMASETDEEKKAFIKQKKDWNDDIEKCEKITKCINFSKGEAHFTADNIKALAEQLLADKQQIVNFMKYEKKKKISNVKKYQSSIQVKLSTLINQRNTTGRNLTKAQRMALEKKIVDKTQIICTTLAMSTNERLDTLSPGDIEYLIVDEACQSVELNNLIPFEHQPQRVILVGDQQQLPATTFSENAERTNYSRSMFERFLANGVEKVMLEIQYRMDPLIREFPSFQFYEQRLQDADSVMSRLETPQFKESKVAVINKKFNAVQFIDLNYSTENSSETSKTNQDEVTFIEQLIKKFINILVENHKSNDIVKSFKNSQSNIKNTPYMREEVMNDLKGSIGIISPYKSQVRCLKDKVFSLLRNYCNINEPQNYVEINTVDAFQGREKDIIIFSCVRSSKERALGFVSDYRRMNVAITRAKHGLFVVGNAVTLSKDRNWKALIKFCKDKNDNNHDKCSFITYYSKDDQIQTCKTDSFKPHQKSQNQSQQNENKSQEKQNHTNNKCQLAAQNTESKSIKYEQLFSKEVKQKEQSVNQPIQIKTKSNNNNVQIKTIEQNNNTNSSFLEQLRENEGDDKTKPKQNTKDSGEEEGQIYSSGQMADKQTTETENQLDKSQELNKNSCQDMNMSSAESGELNNKTENNNCIDKQVNDNKDDNMKLNKSSDQIGNVFGNKPLNEEASDAQSSTYQSYKSNNVYGLQSNQYEHKGKPFTKFNRHKKPFIGQQRKDSFADGNNKNGNQYEKKERERSHSANYYNKGDKDDRRRFSKDKSQASNRQQNQDDQSQQRKRQDCSKSNVSFNDWGDVNSGNKAQQLSEKEKSDNGSKNFNQQNNQEQNDWKENPSIQNDRNNKWDEHQNQDKEQSNTTRNDGYNKWGNQYDQNNMSYDNRQRNNSQNRFKRNSSNSYGDHNNWQNNSNNYHQRPGYKGGQNRSFVWGDNQDNRNSRDNGDNGGRNSRDRGRSRSKSPFNQSGSNWSKKRDDKDLRKQQYHDNQYSNNHEFQRNKNFDNQKKGFQNNNNRYDNFDNRGGSKHHYQQKWNNNQNYIGKRSFNNQNNNQQQVNNNWKQ